MSDVRCVFVLPHAEDEGADVRLIDPSGVYQDTLSLLNEG